MNTLALRVLLPIHVLLSGLGVLPISGTAIELPFELRGHRPVVELTLDGHGEFPFVIDTGAPEAVTLDIDLARRLGLSLTGVFDIPASEGARVRVEHGRAAPFALRLGGKRFMVLEPRVATLSQLEPFDGKAVLGVIGKGLLEAFVVELDYPVRTLRLHKRAGFELPAARDGGERRELEFELLGGRMVAHGELTLTGAEKSLPLRVLVDTGERAAFVVQRSFAQAHDLFLGLDQYHVVTIGAGLDGASRGSLLRCEALSVGSIHSEHPLITLARDRTGRPAADRIDAILGGPILREYRVFIDYASRRMTLERDFETPLATHEDCSGLYLVAEPDGAGCRVVSVHPASPAAAAGIAVGNRITAVDGRSVRSIGLDGVRDLLTGAGVSVALGMVQGTQRMSKTLTLTRLP